MSELDNASDPFADINFDDFKSNENVDPGPTTVNQDQIRRLAEENDFKSREGNKPKEKIIVKTFSLFPSDHEIINQAIKDSIDRHGKTSSGSDIVRAALHVFATLSADEQDNYIQKHKGRGRKG